MIVRYVALCAAHAHTHGTHTWHAHALASNTLWPEVASAGFDGYQFFYLPHQDPVPRRALAAFGFAIALTASTPGDHSTCTHDTHLTATPCLFTFSPAFIVCRLPSLCGSTLQTKVISIATHQNVLYTHSRTSSPCSKRSPDEQHAKYKIHATRQKSSSSGTRTRDLSRVKRASYHLDHRTLGVGS